MLDAKTDSVVIKGNLVSNNYWYGIAISGYGHEITDNTIEFNSIAPGLRGQILFFNSRGNASWCTVVGNNINSRKGQYLIAVTGTGPYEPHVFAENIYEITDPTVKDSSNAFYWTPNPMNFSDWRKLTNDASAPPIINGVPEKYESNVNNGNDDFTWQSYKQNITSASQGSVNWIQKAYIAYYGKIITEFITKDDITLLKFINNDYAKITKLDTNTKDFLHPEPNINIDLRYGGNDFIGDFVKIYEFWDNVDLVNIRHAMDILGIDKKIINEIGVAFSKDISLEDRMEVIEAQIAYFIDCNIDLNTDIQDFYIEIGGMQILRKDT